MASNFFNKASLVMVPDAPIDGKLPSVKPEDRSGDFTFSRGSNLAATRINKDGLIEKGRENLLPRSNSFNSAPWSTSSSNATIGQSGYDGTNDAWLLSKTAINGRAQQNLVITGVQTFSVYAKAGTNTWMNLLINGSVSPSVFFDLQNGVLGSVSSTIEAKIVSVGNGWYRCSATFSTTTSRYRIYVSDGNNDNTGTSGNILIQDAQLELGLVATGYIETTTAAVQKGILENLPRIDYSGGASCPSLLLEPQRTNVITQSEYITNTIRATITHNQATSPEGLQNAILAVDSTDANNHQCGFGLANLGVTDTAVYSVFAKKQNHRYINLRIIDDAAGAGTGINLYNATFDLENGVVTDDFESGTPTNPFSDIEDYGNGWFRCWVGLTKKSGVARTDYSVYLVNSSAAGSNPTYAGTGNDGNYLYGHQLETGSYPTSYIPTYGTSQTRSLDDAQTTPADTIDTQSFTLFFEHKALGSTGTDWIYRLDINGTSDNISFYVNSSVALNVYLGNANGGYIFGSGDNDGFTIGSNSKVALSYDGNRLAYFINGGLYDSATGVSFNDAHNKLIIRGVKNIINKQTAAFPTALTDDECIALTTI